MSVLVTQVYQRSLRCHSGHSVVTQVCPRSQRCAVGNSGITQASLRCVPTDSGITQVTPRCVPQQVDLSPFELVALESHLSRYAADWFLPRFRVTRRLVLDVAAAPDPPPRPKPVRMKVNR